MQEARKQEASAKQLNDQNQAAILRLMNELQSVAEGDLTQEATVTEDITGAIADSVNYTLEEFDEKVEVDLKSWMGINNLPYSEYH